MYTLNGKTILITGATDGLGKLVAMQAAAKGGRLLLHGRNAEKGNRLLEELRSTTNNQDIFYYNADLSSLEETKKMSEDILAAHQSLHVLINNAAVGGGPKGGKERELSRDGYELRFAVNYLSHFLLTQKLLPLLTRSSPARIVNVSSIGQTPLNFEDMQSANRYSSFDAYCKSKLAQIMYGFELAELLKGKGVTVNSLHPATLMDTKMVHDFFGKVSSTPEEGARVVEHVAFSEETDGITGAYFNQLQQTKANAQAYDSETRKKLWELSEQLTKAFL